MRNGTDFMVKLPENKEEGIVFLTMIEALGFKAYDDKGDTKNNFDYLKASGWKFIFISDNKYVGARHTSNKKIGYLEDLVKFAADSPVVVKLNNQHTAEIHKDVIKVGCQEFSFGAFDDLAKAVKEVRARS